jgi:hypothetical protein
VEVLYLAQAHLEAQRLRKLLPQTALLNFRINSFNKPVKT